MGAAIELHTSAAAYALTPWLRDINTSPVVAIVIIVARPWGRPHESMIFAIGSFKTPLMMFATIPIVGISEWEENSLTT